MTEDLKTKKCPFCAEEILIDAVKCKHCGSMLDGSEPTHSVSVTKMDPFAHYHTNIQGKKKGRLTFVGWLGIVFGDRIAQEVAKLEASPADEEAPGKLSELQAEPSQPTQPGPRLRGSRMILPRRTTPG
jgi:hypothetical protein